MNRLAFVALLLCSSCSDAGSTATEGTGIDDPGSGGAALGTGGESSPGTGGMTAPGGSGGAATGGAATATGGAGAAGAAAVTTCGSLGGQCEAGSLCYVDHCAKACATDAECGTGERCGELYQGRFSETNRPPLGCLKPCHVPGVSPDVSGCGGQIPYCEFYIGSRIVGADDGSWLPSPDICAGGAHFCAASTTANVTGVHLCETHTP